MPLQIHINFSGSTLGKNIQKLFRIKGELIFKINVQPLLSFQQ